jgi:hypothetical protein
MLTMFAFCAPEIVVPAPTQLHHEVGHDHQA